MLRLGQICAAFAMAGVGVASSAAAEAVKPVAHTIGLVVTVWDSALYETPDASECPNGFHSSNNENWHLQYPTEEQRAEFTKKNIKFGPHGALGTVPVNAYTRNRGPDGINVLYNPASVKDPPLREIRSKIGLGMNLDGNVDGSATSKTCRHENFTTPNGAPGVDNQLYRVLGCWPSMRKGGAARALFLDRNRIHNFSRFLIEISDVDDEMNDAEVKVAVFKGIDSLRFDANGAAQLWQTHRIDARFPKYMSRTSGKIVDGVLRTEPVDLWYAPTRFTPTIPVEYFLRDMRIELKLTETGAQGMLAGYQDVRQYYIAHAEGHANSIDSILQWNPPAFYEALNRLADGYPDPKSGQCTAISTAYSIESTRVFVVHPSQADPMLADPVQVRMAMAKEKAQKTAKPEAGEKNNAMIAREN
jgi:hypothetical protein